MSQTGQNDKSIAIGVMIKKYRTIRGLSQTDLSAKLGIDNSYLSRIELGDRTPSENVIRLMAKVFGISTEQFLYAAGLFTKEELREMGVILPCMLPALDMGDTLDNERMVTIEALLEHIKARLETLESGHNDVVSMINRFRKDLNL